MTDRTRGHRLERVCVWLPGPKPTGYRPTVAADPAAGHWRRFVRCRDCGADRECAADFRTPCSGGATRPLAAADD